MICNLDDIIKSSGKILLLSHMNPDGDTLGSMCALYSMIYHRFKKKADMNVVSNIHIIINFCLILIWLKDIMINHLFTI